MCRCIIIAIGYLLALPVIAVESPTAFELLQKFVETQNKLRSFIIKSQDSIEISSPRIGREKQEKMLSSEFRFDGSRAKICEYAWGQVQTGENFIPKDKAAYVSYSN